MARKPESATLVSFGAGGHSIAFPQSTLSGYERPNKPPVSCEDYIIPAGTPVLDKTGAVETDAGVRMALRGPMYQHGGEPGARPDWSKPYAGLHSLDFADLDTYKRLWLSVGARLGTYAADGQIVWES